MTKAVKVGNVIVGGGAPISIQSMTNTKTSDIKSTILQINSLADLGADIVRVAVLDKESAAALKNIITNVNVPIVADIHYDYRLALLAIENGAHKIRINPSNTTREGIKQVAKLAKEKGIPIRVGVNQGSITDEIDAKGLAELTLDCAKLLEDNEFTDIVLAVKTSNTLKTIDAYRCLHQMTDYPLHIGLTESGTKSYGTVKSSIALGILINEGIGDTMRVSLSSPPEEEVLLAKKILRALGKDKEFVEIISCPTCGRCSIDVEKIASELEKATENIKRKLKIAVMGCSVNGIGEAKDADFGVFGGCGKSVIIVDKQIVKSVENDKITQELLGILNSYGKY